ncbi:MAG: hypothetical protein A2Y41_05955 [Spirochaetes bacterium GWB1_36_13]|nr:MAG: hypothetical protein A2Y41_05955 [Spirochaetes bacterium GWB1_36_13]
MKLLNLIFQNKNNNQSNFLKELFIVFIFAIISFIFFYDVFFKNITFVFSPDTSESLYPCYYFAAKSLKSGVFPFWNSYLFSGFPFDAYPAVGLFYTINWLFWVFPYSNDIFPYYAYEYLTIFHVFLAGWFMYLLVKKLQHGRIISVVAGILYMLNANFLHYIGWEHLLSGFSWFPLLFLFFYNAFQERKIHYSFFSGIILGIIFLTSRTQAPIMAIMLIGLFFIYNIVSDFKDKNLCKKYFLYIFITATVGVLLGAVSILPVLEFTPLSLRFLGPDGILVGNEKMSIAAFTHFKLNINHLLGFFTLKYSNAEVANTFLGVVPFSLSLFSVIFYRKSNNLIKFLLIVFVISLFYSLGFLLPYVFYFIPLADKIREPQLYFIYISFVVPILSAFALKNLFNGEFAKKINNLKKKKIFSILLFVILFMILSFLIKDNKLILSSILFFMLLFLFIKIKNQNILNVFKVMLILLILYEIKPLHGIDNKNIKIQDYFNSFNQLNVLKPENNLDKFRVTAVEGEKWPYPHNAGTIIGFYDTLGYGNPLLYKFFDYRNKVSYNAKYYDMLNVKYFISYSKSNSRIAPFIGEEIQEVNSIKDIWIPDYYKKEKHEIYLYENKNRFGQAWVVDDISLPEEYNNIISLIEDKNINLKQTAFINHSNISQEIYNEIKEVNKNELVKLEFFLKIVKYEDNKITIEVNSNKKSLLVLSELYYPGWKVYVNGKKEDLLEVNNILRGNIIQKGQNVVEYVYEPKGVKVGVIISLITLFLSIFIILNEKYFKLNFYKINLSYFSIGIIAILLIPFFIFIFSINTVKKDTSKYFSEDREKWKTYEYDNISDINQFNFIESYKHAEIDGIQETEGTPWKKTITVIDVVKNEKKQPNISEKAIFMLTGVHLFYKIQLSEDKELYLKGELSFWPGAKDWNVSDGFIGEIIVVPDGQKEEIVFSNYINPKDDIHKIKISLKKFKGKKIKIIFLTKNELNKNGNGDWAIWINPEITMDYKKGK